MPEGQRRRALANFARTIRCRHFGQPVFSDLVRRAGSQGRKAAFWPRPQTALPHEPGDPVLAATLSRFAQVELHARAAGGVPALREALPDERAKLRVAL